MNRLQRNFAMSNTPRTKRLGLVCSPEILKNKQFYKVLKIALVVVLLAVSVTFVKDAITISENHMTLNRSVTELNVCFEQNKFNTCFDKLTITSKLLDKTKADTSLQAVQWGRAQTYALSAKFPGNEELQKYLIRWAAIEKYIGSETDYIPLFADSVYLFQQEMKVRYTNDLRI
jgi:hypothetical protein